MQQKHLIKGVDQSASRPDPELINQIDQINPFVRGDKAATFSLAMLMNQTLPSPATSLEKPALLGGRPAVVGDDTALFKWPLITAEDETAVLEVLREGKMSGWDISMAFEKEFAAWNGTRYALAHNTGTASLQAAMFAVGVGRGDEIIAPTQTYWASCLQAFSLGATVVFADVDEKTFCLDPNDLEHRITPRTKAIVVVHYLGYPCEMDPIMEIANRHGIKVIEDVSHAQGGTYRGRPLGSIGHVAGISLMTGKAFAIGEGGMLVTNDPLLYERAVAFGHYERFNASATNTQGEPYRDATLATLYGLPLGGNKYRMHQMSSAVGRVQLRYFDARMAEIRKAMDYFWSLLKGVPGIAPREPEGIDKEKMTYYEPRAHYRPEEVGGLSVTRLVEALRAEGYDYCFPGLLRPLHTHPVFNHADVYHDGRPTRIAHSPGDLREPLEAFPVSQRLNERSVTIPWFKHFEPEAIERYALAFRKVLLQADQLLEGDRGNAPSANQGALNMSTKAAKK